MNMNIFTKANHMPNFTFLITLRLRRRIFIFGHFMFFKNGNSFSFFPNSFPLEWKNFFRIFYCFQCEILYLKGKRVKLDYRKKLSENRLRTPPTKRCKNEGREICLPALHELTIREHSMETRRRTIKTRYLFVLNFDLCII
jgi:hypothetical protein